MSTAFTKANTPAVLPERAEGWTKRMGMHLNLGRAKAASYSVRDDQGRPMPISYAYRVRDKDPKANYQGFFLEGHEGVMTWAELRAAWPAFYSTLPD
jgi:hypothetical protein